MELAPAAPFHANIWVTCCVRGCHRLAVGTRSEAWNHGWRIVRLFTRSKPEWLCPIHTATNRED